MKKDGRTYRLIFFAIVLNAINSFHVYSLVLIPSVKALPFAAGFSRPRANAASRQSLGQSYSLRYNATNVTLYTCPAARPPVVFPPRFSRALSVPPFSEASEPFGGSAQGNGIRDNHRGAKPLGSSPRPF